MGKDISFKWCPCFFWVSLEDKEGSWCPYSLLVGFCPLNLWLCPNCNWDENNSFWTHYLHALFGCTHEKNRTERQNMCWRQRSKRFLSDTQALEAHWNSHACISDSYICRLWDIASSTLCFLFILDRSICKNRWRRPKQSISFLTSVVLTRNGMVSYCSSKCCTSHAKIIFFK